ncbi:MAG: GatB/YqeY domain-containing protein [Gammaproteobacteria bacterium]|nr:MAG: GatB/YqeY domain-containing protein [Gammaproteobacteria bacterium]
MPLKARLTEDMKQAMRAGDKPRLAVIRMGLAAIKQREVDERIELDDAQILSIIEKMIKQRRESASQFRAGNREDLAEREDSEIIVLQSYLPEPLSEAAIETLIEDALQTTGATSMRDMGKVMAEVRAAAQGRVDMAVISARVKSRLGRS